MSGITEIKAERKKALINGLPPIDYFNMSVAKIGRFLLRTYCNIV